MTFWPAVLTHNKLRQLGIRLLNIYRKLETFFINPHYKFPPSHGQGSLTQVQ